MFNSVEKYSSVLHLMIVSIVALDPPAVRMKYGFSIVSSGNAFRLGCIFVKSAC